MTERQDDDNRPPGEDEELPSKESSRAGAPQDDLRSIMGVNARMIGRPGPERRPVEPSRDEGADDEVAPPYVPPVRDDDPEPRRGSFGRPAEQAERSSRPAGPTSPDEVAPPYVPPVREGDPERPGERPTARPDERSVPPTADRGQVPTDEVAQPYVPPVREGGPEQRVEHPPEPPAASPGEPNRESEKLPPVWPGDENQPWFRKERGLPPLPESETPEGRVDVEDLPTPLADIPTRGRAFGASSVLPAAALWLIPGFGVVVWLAAQVANLFLFSRGQDIGAAIFGLRVLRDNGDVAGFFHMFVRNTASTISLLAFGAGFWAAFSDPERRTWHDRWLGTHVVKDSKEYNDRRRSSSRNAYNWFWIIILVTIAATVAFALSGPLPTEVVPTPEAGGVEGGGLEGTPGSEVPTDSSDAAGSSA